MYYLEYYDKEGNRITLEEFKEEEEARVFLDDLITTYTKKGTNVGSLELIDDEDKVIIKWENNLEDGLKENINLEEEKSDDIDNFIDDIYELRKNSVASEGEYGLGNLIFKEFRNLGYLDNLKELRKIEKGKELSLEKLAESNSEFTEHIPMGEEDFEKFKSSHPEFTYNETPFGVTIFKEKEQLGTYLKQFKEVWCKEKELFNENIVEEEYQAKLNDKNLYLINEYRKYANLDENCKITEENLDKWALNRTSAVENYDVNELKELLLRGE